REKDLLFASARGKLCVRGYDLLMILRSPLMGNITELIWAAGIIAIVTIFGMEKPRPIEYVPVCSITCEPFNGGVTPSEPATIQWILTSLSGVTCRSKTEYIWNDFTQRVVDRGGYCGVCGTPTKCPDIKQFDDRK
ncbi:MAG: hypothetical protein MN733_07850, partial [Nitrososphaera sp.]|nr:hypothetical protein [Nitrososphaera sp.]